jgi:hypothetical protein
LTSLCGDGRISYLKAKVASESISQQPGAIYGQNNAYSWMDQRKYTALNYTTHIMVANVVPSLGILT